MPTSTPTTEQIADTLRRYREAAGLTQRGLATAAGIGPNQVARFEQGATPMVSTLERLADVLGVRLSRFIAACEASARAAPVPLEVVQREVRPSRDWLDAVSQAAACLRVDGFGGALLLYGDRWCTLAPQDRGRVRIDQVRGGERELAVLESLLRAAARETGPVTLR